MPGAAQGVEHEVRFDRYVPVDIQAVGSLLVNGETTDKVAPEARTCEVFEDLVHVERECRRSESADSVEQARALKHYPRKVLHSTAMLSQAGKRYGRLEVRRIEVGDFFKTFHMLLEPSASGNRNPR